MIPVEMSVAAGLALVFDLDGVIVDSMPVHTQAWRVYLEKYGIDPRDLESRMHGRRNAEIVADILGAHLTPQEIFEHGAAKERLYREMTGVDLESHLVPGIREFLERYAAVPLAVASNAEPANISFILDGAKLRSFFQAVVDGMQVTRPKPFPDVYMKAAEKLGIAPRDCIVFEDSPPGVEAARSARARVVGVETHEPLQNVDFRIPNFQASEIDAWLAAQRVS